MMHVRVHVSRSVSCIGLLNFFVNACMLVYCIHGVVALLTLVSNCCLHVTYSCIAYITLLTVKTKTIHVQFYADSFK